MSSATLWSRLIRAIAGTKITQKSIKRPLRASPALESLEGRAVPAVAVFNPTGGLTATDGIRVSYADANFSVLRNNTQQLFRGAQVPNSDNYNGIYLATGDSTNGGTIVRGPANTRLNAPNMTIENWTQIDTYAVQNPSANNYTFYSELIYTDAGGKSYYVDFDASYTYPNQYFTLSFVVHIPQGNTKDVRLFTAFDTLLGGNDAGPGFIDSTGPANVNNGVKAIGVTGSDAKETISYVSGPAWEGYASAEYYEIVFSQATTTGPGFGKPYLNNINTSPATDNGMGVNWNFGSAAGISQPVVFDFKFESSAPPPPDTTAPANPLIASVTTDTGISPTDQITMDNTLTFTGTAEASSVVKIYSGTILIGTGTASSTGAFSITASILPDNIYSNFGVTATDAAGNVSNRVSISSWEIDTVCEVDTIDSTNSSGNYKRGQTITISLDFGEDVHVTGAPGLLMNSGGFAQYISGSGTNVLEFSYTILRGEEIPSGVPYLEVLQFDFSSGSITDTAGNIPAVSLIASGANGIQALSSNKQIVIDNRVSVSLIPYQGSFIDDTVTPGFGKTNLAFLSYLATFDEVVDNLPRAAFLTSGLQIVSVHRIANGAGLLWKIDAKPLNPVGSIGSTSIQVLPTRFYDVGLDMNQGSNVVAVDVLRNMKLTSALSVGLNTAKVIGRTATITGLSIAFSGPVDPANVVASAFETRNSGTITNLVVASDNRSATFDLAITNGGSAFSGLIRVNVIDKAIQDEYGNKVKGSAAIQWTYDGIGATGVFSSSAAARVRAGLQVEWSVTFSEAVRFTKSNMTVTIGGVAVNPSQITVRGSSTNYTVTLNLTSTQKGALVVTMKSGSAGPLDLRGNELAVIPTALAKTTIV